MKGAFVKFQVVENQKMNLIVKIFQFKLRCHIFTKSMLNERQYESLKLFIQLSVYFLEKCACIPILAHVYMHAFASLNN